MDDGSPPLFFSSSSPCPSSLLKSAAVAAILLFLPTTSSAQFGSLVGAPWQQQQLQMPQIQQSMFGAGGPSNSLAMPQNGQSLFGAPGQQSYFAGQSTNVPAPPPSTSGQQLVGSLSPGQFSSGRGDSMRFREVETGPEGRAAAPTSLRDVAVSKGSFLPKSPIEDSDGVPEDQVGDDARFMESRTEGDPRLVVADKIAQEARFASVDLLGTSTAKEDDEDDKLAQPLREVKQDIVEKAKQIKQENAWIEQVATVISSYEKKVGNVKANVVSLRKEVRELLRKKRQIQNLVLQQELQKKLDDASADMGTIENALTHVKSKADNFERTRNNLKETVANLKKALSGLKGTDDEKAEEPAV